MFYIDLCECNFNYFNKLFEDFTLVKLFSLACCDLRCWSGDGGGDHSPCGCTCVCGVPRMAMTAGGLASPEMEGQ